MVFYIHVHVSITHVKLSQQQTRRGFYKHVLLFVRVMHIQVFYIYSLIHVHVHVYIHVHVHVHL